MEFDKSRKGKKRSKAYYRKCAHGGKRQCLGTNILEPGIKGFLVMCNHNEKSAVREAYNILNEYADTLYGREKQTSARTPDEDKEKSSDENTDEDDDVEKALKKEVDEMKSIASSEKRFQNVMTKAKNCVFIRTSLNNPVEVIAFVMEDIAKKKLKRARYAARILPIVGTCKANIPEIEKLAMATLPQVFSPDTESVPESYTIIYKSRNNNGTCCGREAVVSALLKIVKKINPEVKFTWSDYSLAILVEIVCTVCCIGVAPNFIRLRKYNLQELSKGNMTKSSSEESHIKDDKEESWEKDISEDAQVKDVVEDEQVQEKDLFEDSQGIVVENSLANDDLDKLQNKGIQDNECAEEGKSKGDKDGGLLPTTVCKEKEESNPECKTFDDKDGCPVVENT